MGSSKYPKKDIIYLKEIFDAYDADGSGVIDRAELRHALQKQKEAKLRYDGTPKSLEERHAERGVTYGQAHQLKGVFLVDFSESLFRAMDTNTDGQIEFGELIRMLYPFATDAELQTMLGWVSKSAPEARLEDFRLNDDQRQQIHAMFRLYDRDGSGAISLSEFRHAMRRCGLDAEEALGMFSEADADGNKSISLDEFTNFMKQTLFDNERLSNLMRLTA